jgi:signal transduction histidine kinase
MSRSGAVVFPRRRRWPMLLSVTQTGTERGLPAAGLSTEVLVVAGCFALSAGVAAVAALFPQTPPSLALVVGWPVFALVGGVVLDQRPGSLVGRAITLLALFSVLDMVWAAVRFGPDVSSADLARAVTELAAVQTAAVGLTLPWAFRAPRRVGAATLSAVLAAVGAVAVVLSRSGAAGGMVGVGGWSMVVLGCAGVWVLVAGSAWTDDRADRRRVAWLLVTLTLAGGVVLVGFLRSTGDLGYYLTGSVVALTAVTAARLWLGAHFRSLAEHLLDLGLVAGVAGSAGLTALLVRLGAGWTRLPSAGTLAVFTALVTAAMAAPAAWWLRRTTLDRRFGSGTISPADVAVITADLHAHTEPRDLLDKAARIVASASGSGEAHIVLGEEEPVLAEHWVLHPLDVGGDRVGSLAIASEDPEGPELRQQRVVAQLLPTVALVARAVGLAVEAEHARRDVARERDAERKRVMGDLHDGLGPVLAGMSMRVQAALRTSPSSEHAGLLSDLAASLSAGRTDLRRIVAGITPAMLEDGDLAGALDRLVGSFRDTAGGPHLSLEVDLATVLSPDVQVAVYRSVAEGLTNALRHAAASRIDVRVCARGDAVLVDVLDDGAGGRVVPGVGLSSLARRADSLGGVLEVAPAKRRGTHLHLELPGLAEAPT